LEESPAESGVFLKCCGFLCGMSAGSPGIVFATACDAFLVAVIGYFPWFKFDDAHL
jgi:hypothetical protein